MRPAVLAEAVRAVSQSMVRDGAATTRFTSIDLRHTLLMRLADHGVWPADLTEMQSSTLERDGWWRDHRFATPELKTALRQLDRILTSLRSLATQQWPP